MYPRQRIDPPFHRADVSLDVLAAGQPDDGLRQRQRILGAVIDFPCQEILPLFGALALCDVDGDAADAYHTTALVDGCGRCADTPANLAARPHDAELRLI